MPLSLTTEDACTEETNELRSADCAGFVELVEPLLPLLVPVSVTPWFVSVVVVVVPLLDPLSFKTVNQIIVKPPAATSSTTSPITTQNQGLSVEGFFGGPGSNPPGARCGALKDAGEGGGTTGVSDGGGTTCGATAGGPPTTGAPPGSSSKVKFPEPHLPQNLSLSGTSFPQSTHRFKGHLSRIELTLLAYLLVRVSYSAAIAGDRLRTKVWSYTGKRSPPARCARPSSARRRGHT